MRCAITERMDDERTRANARQAWKNVCTALAYDGHTMRCQRDRWIFTAWRKSPSPRLRTRRVSMHRIDILSMGHVGVRTFQQRLGWLLVGGPQMRGTS